MVDVADLMHKHLEIYDSLSKKDCATRRSASKALYDYFQLLLSEVGSRFYNIDKNWFYQFHLKKRWMDIKMILPQDDKEKNRWDNIIGRLSKIRGSVEHADLYDPSIEDLEKIREKTKEFTEWIIAKSKQYHSESSGFYLLDAFKFQLFSCNDRANWKLAEYGEKPYIATEYEYRDKFENVTYKNLPDTIKKAEERLKELKNVSEITKDDIELLIGLVKFIAELECREYCAISKEICPKCGGKITSTEQYIGGGYEEPPSEVYYRVGCEKCDYILQDETFSI